LILAGNKYENFVHVIFNISENCLWPELFILLLSERKSKNQFEKKRLIDK